MFLNGLKYEQRKYFLGMARDILKADKHGIDAAEEEYLRALCREMDLSFSDSASYDKKNLSKMFNEQSERKIVILELIALAFSNNELHDNETKFIIDVINQFGMEASIFDISKKAILDYKIIQSKIIDFISE